MPASRQHGQLRSPVLGKEGASCREVGASSCAPRQWREAGAGLCLWRPPVTPAAGAGGLLVGEVRLFCPQKGLFSLLQTSRWCVVPTAPEQDGPVAFTLNSGEITDITT